jgi:aspartokinase-like uncharacterized kinase
VTAGPVVVKVGGSLLDLPDLGERISRFLKSLAGRSVLLLAGGGAAADLVREWDRRYHLGEEASHCLAIRMLSVSTHLLARLVPSAEVITSLDACSRLWDAGALPVLDPLALLLADDASPAALPHTWDVTSDSITARVAELAGAEELILLKSSAPRKSISLSEAARTGLVDTYFPQAARSVPRVTLLNLRHGQAGLVELQPGGWGRTQ